MMVRTQVTLASTTRPLLSSMRSWVVVLSNSGRSAQQREHVAGQILRCGDALQDEWVDFLVEHRGAGRGVRLGKAGFGVLQVGLGGVLSPDRDERRGGVEAAGNESDCSGDDYGRACGGGVEPAGSLPVGRAEADGRQEGEDDDEVG